VVAWWHPDHKQLPLVLDASTLGQRFTILAVCVVIRGSAIPVAWKIVDATQKGAWKPHWEGLLATLKGTVPALSRYRWRTSPSVRFSRTCPHQTREC
jgi:hypothetical protein